MSCFETVTGERGKDHECRQGGQNTDLGHSYLFMDPSLQLVGPLFWNQLFRHFVLCYFICKNRDNDSNFYTVFFLWIKRVTIWETWRAMPGTCYHVLQVPCGPGCDLLLVLSCLSRAGRVVGTCRMLNGGPEVWWKECYRDLTSSLGSVITSIMTLSSPLFILLSIVQRRTCLFLHLSLTWE